MMSIKIHAVASRLVFTALACFGTIALGQISGQRFVGPIETVSKQSLADYSPEWIQVKFVEDSDVVMREDTPLEGTFRFQGRDSLEMESVNAILKDAIEVRRTFSGPRERFKQYKAIGEANSGVVGPDLGLWFDVRFDRDRNALAQKLNELNACEAVEICHGVPRVEPASCFLVGNTPDFTGQQGYLYDTPFGLDAPAAWALPGGRGETMKFIDVERNWFRAHEDFDQDKFFFQNAVNNIGVSSNHGTAVLGEVIGADNGFGITGFASEAEWGTVAYPTASHPLVAQYFMEAAEALSPGDVWLIEIQMFPSGMNATPMEYLQANYDAIWTSSFALNVTCVEAGANGSQDLDSNAFGNLFDRNFRDSGAIMVAAGRPTSLTAEGFSNFGSRMDAHAWGSSIVTTGYGTLQNGPTAQLYASSFGGTSGASPMIVGAALCLQGIQKAKPGGSAMSPIEIRQVIVDSGTPHTDVSREIGPRPNIAAAIDLLPEVCILGDANMDGMINLLDVGSFVNALETGTYLCQADVNQDGDVNLLDVTGFVDILSNGG